MSKLDAQRAMREANYARNSGRRAAAAGETAAAPAARASKPARTVAAAPVAPTGERCGHKSMNGRACSREAAHPEKNHRYS
ncbi:hypothetical protein [Kineococcus rubinsiae]|uniref:hypothetical protein n=1 Tax=Kineococcus rubinsiae TaxID=2609562 RepID=UPI001431567D|nr:hypothetical protein [Kineococcus rubinsiae]NIZ90942.1 hypothetical protein [Kineococcus rubinsiae]